MDLILVATETNIGRSRRTSHHPVDSIGRCASLSIALLPILVERAEVDSLSVHIHKQTIRTIAACRSRPLVDLIEIELQDNVVSCCREIRVRLLWILASNTLGTIGMTIWSEETSEATHTSCAFPVRPQAIFGILALEVFHNQLGAGHTSGSRLGGRSSGRCGTRVAEVNLTESSRSWEVNNQLHNIRTVHINILNRVVTVSKYFVTMRSSVGGKHLQPITSILVDIHQTHFVQSHNVTELDADRTSARRIIGCVLVRFLDDQHLALRITVGTRIGTSVVRRTSVVATSWTSTRTVLVGSSQIGISIVVALGIVRCIVQTSLVTRGVSAVRLHSHSV
mmetsp:Transcript_21469/g.36564  ORF Transcript_21469/g.36564 Transcript_21469/m.36564 type:complete len:337 (+) Transcript_21469:294-1304(+)